MASSDAEDEALLLASVRMGDPAAMRALYERHARAVMTNARRLGLPAAEVEDVAQDVFVAAFRDVAKIRPGALPAYLFRLTSNRVNDRFRRRRVRDAFNRLFGASEPAIACDSPERTALRRDAERRVGCILARMSQKKREVFVLFEIQGASGQEIADTLRIPVETVWTRLHHAREEFAKIARSMELLDGMRSGEGTR